MSDPDDFAAAVVAYLDGGADAQAVRRLEAQLRAQPALRAEFVALATMQGLLEELTLAPVASHGHLQVSPRPARSVRPWLLAAAVAALLVLGLTWWSLSPRAAREVGEIDALQGRVSLERAGTLVSLVVGSRLRADDALHAVGPGSCAWHRNDHSRVVITADAEVVLHAEAPGQATIELTQGELTAEVTPQPAGQHFQVRTPHGLVTVVGTAFRVAVDAQGTRLAVSHGTVSLQDVQGLAVAVHSGERAQIDAQHGWVARLVPPIEEPAPVPPTRPQPPASALTALTAGSFLHPFASSSWWNRPCPPDLVLSAPQGALAVAWEQLEIGSVQVRQVVESSAAIPLRQVVRRGGSQALGTVRVPWELRLQSGVSQDGFLIVIDPQARTIWEGARPEIKRDGTIAVTAVSELPLDGEGVPTEVAGASQSAAPEGQLPSGVPACAGLLRPGELEQGIITHVLAMTLPARSLNAAVDGDVHWVAPATGPRFPPPVCAQSGNLHVGSRLVLPSGTAERLADGPLRVLALALERYGACVVGFSDRPQLCAEATASAQAAPMTSALATLCTQLRVAQPR